MQRHRLHAGILVLVIAAGVMAMAASRSAAPVMQAGPRTVVVAELFTSEGCSSCPAADDLLREWLATQPVPGVEIVGLSEHVDYWDRLGWRDPFSSPAFSARQSAYDAAVFRSHRVYTPQLVVDGRLEAVGSDAEAVRRAVIEAARQPKADVEVSALADWPDRLQVRVRVQVPAGVPRQGVAEVVLAVTEDGLATKVARGENGGRTLRHAAVTRSLTTIGVVSASAGDSTLHGSVPLTAGWSRPHVRLVALVQERDSRRILGAASVGLAGAPTQRGGRDEPRTGERDHPARAAEAEPGAAGWKHKPEHVPEPPR